MRQRLLKRRHRTDWSECVRIYVPVPACDDKKLLETATNTKTTVNMHSAKRKGTTT
jgi:hypothetical protein